MPDTSLDTWTPTELAIVVLSVTGSIGREFESWPLRYRVQPWASC